MRVSLFLVFCYLSIAIWAGGYQGCLERVWLFQAYEIDALNPIQDQTIGFRCARPVETTKQCNQWNACRPGRNSGRNRCNFDELMKSLGKAPTMNKGQSWIVLDDDGKLDTERTAKNCYTLFTTSQSKSKKVVNFPPFTAVKGAWEYNDYIMRLSTTVNHAFWTKKTDANRHLWASFDDTREKISVARAGDHGTYLIKAAETYFGDKMSLQTQKLGSNPATGEVWETVDWKKTALEAKNKGLTNPGGRIQAFLDNFYRGTQTENEYGQARNHHQVLRSYKRVADRSQSCRKH